MLIQIKCKKLEQKFDVTMIEICVFALVWLLTLKFLMFLWLL